MRPSVIKRIIIKTCVSKSSCNDAETGRAPWRRPMVIKHIIIKTCLCVLNTKRWAPAVRIRNFHKTIPTNQVGRWAPIVRIEKDPKTPPSKNRLIPELRSRQGRGWAPVVRIRPTKDLL